MIDASAEEVKIKFVNEIFRIMTRSSMGGGEEAEGSSAENGAEGVARMEKPDCDHCKDNPRRKCKFCACCVCGGKDSPDKQILCDECDLAYHLWCVEPTGWRLCLMWTTGEGRGGKGKGFTVVGLLQVLSKL